MVISFFSGCLPLGLKPTAADRAPVDTSIQTDVTTSPEIPADDPQEGEPVVDLPGGPADLRGDYSEEQPETQTVFPPQQPNHYYHFLVAQLLGKRGSLDRAIQHLRQSIDGDPESSYLKRELALLHLRQNDTEGALRIIEAQLERTPDDIDALILYGKMKQSLKQVAQALRVYEKVIDRDPKQEGVYLFLGGIYMERNDRGNAMRVYTQLIEHFPQSYVGHFFLGKIHADSGDVDAATRAFQKTLELDPDLEEPKLELLKIYRSRGESAKIIDTYRQILSRNPRNYRAAMALGYYYHQNNAPKAAEKVFVDLGKRSLSDPDVMRNAVRAYLDAKRFDEAIVVFEGMLKAAPDNSGLHYITGIAYDGIKDLERTVAHLQEVQPESRFFKSAVVHVSYLLRKQGKNDDAIRSLTDAIQAHPEDPEFFLELGNVYGDSKRYRDAVEALRQGLEVDPGNVNLRFRLGAVYDQWGLKDESIAEMKAVIRLDPKHANALNYLGYTYADLGKNLDEAERLIKEALKHDPESGYITDSLGWVYYKKGLFEQALGVLEKAASLVPDDPVILEHLGDAYQKVNNKEKALEFYNRSLLKLDEGNSGKANLERKIRKLTESGS